ncbi:zinc ribbon domain-containing protein [Thermogemmatispora sp.]|uniref:zinc ribbon domain-containing protein n=1 Tax=Thermogemmatispora sp. TaxID=1968838 RepID=UPI0035E41978
MLAGWTSFPWFCTCVPVVLYLQKALFINPGYPSQVCSGCGAVKRKGLLGGWHARECGTELDRDHNAA